MAHMTAPIVIVETTANQGAEAFPKEAHTSAAQATHASILRNENLCQPSVDAMGTPRTAKKWTLGF
jgi:hypothetical protein